MLEDKWLVWKCKHGSSKALQLIYEKYKNDLLALAIALSNNKTDAEDIVHDIFVSFAQSVGRVRLRTSLKSYLSTSVANRVRNLARNSARLASNTAYMEFAGSDANQPDRLAISKEESQCIGTALNQLPYQQREIIILHLQVGLKFKDIADAQGLSVNTIQSRYRYGLNKLKPILDGEVKK